jgi:membrane protease YdiL (CAAX protease family)
MPPTASSRLKRHSLLLYFALTYAISWGIWMPIVLSAQGLVNWPVPFALYYLGSFGPMLAALIVTGLTEGQAGIRKLLGGLLKWRVELRYYVFAVFAPVGLFALAVAVNRVLTGDWPDLRLLGQIDYMPYLGIPGVLLLWFLTYGLGEETGWRGFSLPRLQRDRPAANAAVILGVLWAGWHLPAFFFRDTYIEMGLVGFPMLAVSVVFASVVFTWLYNSTRGSLPIAILFHIFFNWLSVSEAGGQFVAFMMTAPLIAWAIFVVRRYQPENAAPVIKQIA